MKITFADLYRPGGTIDRGPYALVGILGFALKHNIDRLVAGNFFQRPWDLFNYWVPLRDVARITDLHSSQAVFLETMVAIALPFIWVGVVMTTKRLRSANLPPSLVLLFFVPFLNLVFLLSLCLIPARHSSEPQHQAQPGSHWVRIIPESAFGSAAFSMLITVPVGVGMVWLGTKLVNYGWGLFVALPFAMGFISALVYGVRCPRTLNGCVGVACLSVTLLGLALVAVAIEGFICLAMAIPVALPLAIIGGSLAYLVQRRPQLHQGSPAFLSLLLIFVPGVQWVEHVAPRTPVVYEVRSAIDVDAAPEEVWKQVVAFSQIPPPKEWLFRAGIAYPIRAEILGHGPGAERHCVFSTGAFVEPIQVWDEPRQLKFSVTSNPAPMQEWTPYSHLDAPHLHGFLISNGGRFLLTPLPTGVRTWKVQPGTVMGSGRPPTGACGPMPSFIRSICAF